MLRPLKPAASQMCFLPTRASGFKRFSPPVFHVVNLFDSSPAALQTVRTAPHTAEGTSNLFPFFPATVCEKLSPSFERLPKYTVVRLWAVRFAQLLECRFWSGVFSCHLWHAAQCQLASPHIPAGQFVSVRTGLYPRQRRGSRDGWPVWPVAVGWRPFLFRLKSVNNFWMDCDQTCSEDESSWFWWSSHFSSSSGMRSTIFAGISTTCGVAIHLTPRMNCNTFLGDPHVLTFDTDQLIQVLPLKGVSFFFMISNQIYGHLFAMDLKNNGIVRKWNQNQKYFIDLQGNWVMWQLLQPRIEIYTGLKL